ncbi:MAG: 50S ribosomal protein L22 [Nitrososphaerota archaeon]|jgi:large subunit ribosomal protein L22|nr:50S ribosomal protein L22 [Nitrososphaerota archaeon]
MPKWGYSIIEEMLNSERTAKASGRELKISHKAAREVAKAIKGMELSQAKEYLRDVVAEKKPIPYTRYTKKLGHKGGMQKRFVGRYPVKTAAAVLKVLQAAQANAENKGLDVEHLRIMHSAAYQGVKLKRYTPRAHGRASPKYEITTHFEIVLEEKATSGEQ